MEKRLPLILFCDRALSHLQGPVLRGKSKPTLYYLLQPFNVFGGLTASQNRQTGIAH